MVGEGISGHGAPGAVSAMEECKHGMGSMRSNPVAMAGEVGGNVE